MLVSSGEKELLHALHFEEENIFETGDGVFDVLC